MSIKVLVPRKILKVQGKMSYSESLRAWSTLRFKKELVKEFPQLEEKRSKFGYKAVYYRDISEFEKAVKEMKKDGSLPILLWMFKED